MTDWRAEVHPGEGVVARWGRYVLAIVGAAPADQAQALLDTCRAAAEEGASGRTFLQRLAGYLAATDADAIPAFGVLGPDGDSWVALVHGDAAITATGPDGAVELSGADRPTWVDRYLSASVERIVIGGGVEADGGIGFELGEGIIPGAGLTLMAEEDERPVEVAGDDAEPPAAAIDETALADGGEAARPDEPAAQVADDAEEDDAEEVDADDPAPVRFVSIDLSVQPEELREPLPTSAAEPEQDPENLVTGVNCTRGHFNHPRAAYCALCGISMQQQTHLPVQGPRPPLGIMVFADGMTMTVDGTYVVGREPDRDAGVAGGHARAVTLPDPDQVLSRVHMEIRPNEWDVEVLDRGSANGTYVLADGGDWERLEENSPRRLESGAKVRLGNYQLVYEAHHRRRTS